MKGLVLWDVKPCSLMRAQHNEQFSTRIHSHVCAEVKRSVKEDMYCEDTAKCE
jgi:hypothetical protein